MSEAKRSHISLAEACSFLAIAAILGASHADGHPMLQGFFMGAASVSGLGIVVLEFARLWRHEGDRS
jgi:hypothetical protein